MTLRWYDTSNGYYGTGVSFEKLDYHDLAREMLLENGVYEVQPEYGAREWWLLDGGEWRSYDGTTLDTYAARYRFTVLRPVLRRPE